MIENGTLLCKLSKQLHLKSFPEPQQYFAAAQQKWDFNFLFLTRELFFLKFFMFVILVCGNLGVYVFKLFVEKNLSQPQLALTQPNLTS